MRLRVDSGALEHLVEHTRRCLPEEGCGFLIGSRHTAHRFLPAPNILRSVQAFEVDPGFLFELFRSLRSSGEDLAAICHSHPLGSARPSATDVESAHYPDVHQVIVSFESGAPEVRAWRISEGQVVESMLRATI